MSELVETKQNNTAATDWIPTAYEEENDELANQQSNGRRVLYSIFADVSGSMQSKLNLHDATEQGVSRSNIIFQVLNQLQSIHESSLVNHLIMLYVFGTSRGEGCCDLLQLLESIGSETIQEALSPDGSSENPAKLSRLNLLRQLPHYFNHLEGKITAELNGFFQSEMKTPSLLSESRQRCEDCIRESFDQLKCNIQAVFRDTTQGTTPANMSAFDVKLMEDLDWTCERFVSVISSVFAPYSFGFDQPVEARGKLKNLMHRHDVFVDSYIDLYVNPGDACVFCDTFSQPEHAPYFQKEIVDQLPWSCRNSYASTPINFFTTLFNFSAARNNETVQRAAASRPEDEGIIDRTIRKATAYVMRVQQDRITRELQEVVRQLHEKQMGTAEIERDKFVTPAFMTIFQLRRLFRPSADDNKKKKKRTGEEQEEEGDYSLIDHSSYQRLVDLVEPYIYGETPMRKAIEHGVAVFERAEYLEDSKVLLVLSDGEPTDGSPLPLVQEYKAKDPNAFVATIFLTDQSLSVQGKFLYQEEEPSWPGAMRLMFQMSSAVSIFSPVVQFLIQQRGWKIYLPSSSSSSSSSTKKKESNDSDDNNNALSISGEIKLFLPANNSLLVQEFCEIFSFISQSHDNLIDLIGRVDAQVFSSYGPVILNEEGGNDLPQIGGTCYAHATAAAIYLSYGRIPGKALPSFHELRDELVAAYDADGADTRRVLQEVCPRYLLSCQLLRRERDVRFALSQGRCPVTRLALTRSQWQRFHRFFTRKDRDEPADLPGPRKKRVLRREDVFLPEDEGEGEELLGHAMVLTGCDPTTFTFLNSWGNDWGEEFGFCTIRSKDFMKQLEFYDVLHPRDQRCPADTNQEAEGAEEGGRDINGKEKKDKLSLLSKKEAKQFLKQSRALTSQLHSAIFPSSFFLRSFRCVQAACGRELSLLGGGIRGDWLSPTCAFCGSDQSSCESLVTYCYLRDISSSSSASSARGKTQATAADPGNLK